MNQTTNSWAQHGAMGCFVLLWGSAALFTRWGLDHGTPLAMLLARFGVALPLLLAVGWRRRAWRLPAAQCRQVVATGLLLVGGYSLCYFLAMHHGVTPGLIATILGTQPILTLLLTERRFGAARLAGLLLALAGLALVVLASLLKARLSAPGLGFALGALACMTLGSLQQKRITLAPLQVLPAQYAASLLLFALAAPVLPVQWDGSAAFWAATLWLACGISVVAQLLLYRLIQRGNLVNVTSLFYLVPVVTALLDWWVLGNRMPLTAWAGLAAIVAGIALVFRRRDAA